MATEGAPHTVSMSKPSTTSIRKDPRTLANLSEILSCLSAYQTEEAELSNSLTELLNARDPIISSLNRLRSLVTQLDDLQLEASLLCDKVSNTAKTAERVGSRVRSLDDEMGHVREAADRVAKVMELKTSLSALKSSMARQDWESAARHCARAMSIPRDIISGPFAEMAVPTAESHLPPLQTLQNARGELLKIFRQNFDEACRSRDATLTSRYFKLFPAIGWEAEGLEAYATFVVDLVRVRAPSSVKTSSPLYYITALTALFESIAMIVDQHQPVVEKYYGRGKMNSVVKRLLDECDRVTRGLIDGWEEERSVKRKLTDMFNNPPIPMFTTGHRRPQTAQDEIVVDPREIDKILSEMAGMIGRWSLFKKFLADAMKGDHVPLVETQATDTQQNEKGLIIDQEFHALNNTNSQKLFGEIITNYYLPFENWYIRTIIDKAHRLSSSDSSQYPVITTTPDDVFYVLKSATSRTLTTGFLYGVARSFEQLRDVLERDYIGVIKKKLEDIYRNPGPAVSNIRGEKVDRENRLTFITLLNDLDVSASHLDRLSRDLAESLSIDQYFASGEHTSVKSLITTFASLSSKFRSSLRSGIEQLFNHLMRPKLRNLITDVYKDVSYVLDDDSYAAAEYQDVVRKRFVKAWEGLVDGYKDTFSENNYRLFFGMTLDIVLRPLEKFISSLKFTELGAVRFDRDLRSITTYLASQTAFGDAREKFSRLQQISTLLNLDGDEDVDGFYSSSGIIWKLTAQEARAIASLKV